MGMDGEEESDLTPLEDSDDGESEIDVSEAEHADVCVVSSVP